MSTNTTFVDMDALNNELRKVLLPVTIYVGTEAVLGIFGNLVVLLVFKFRYHVCNFRYFVLCLALTDIIASCTAISGEVITQRYWYNYPFPTVCKIKSFFNMFTVVAETFCLLTIAVDRYRKVCRPLGWQITPRVALVICGFIYFASAVIAAPVIWFWGTHSQQINGSDVKSTEYNSSVMINVTVCEIDQKFVGRSAPRTYTYSLEVINAVSLFPMLILYILVARTLITTSMPKIKRMASISTYAKGQTRCDKKSDTDYTTDDDSKISTNYSFGINEKKVLPLKPPCARLAGVELDISTANSMTSTQAATSTTEISVKENAQNASRPFRRSQKKKRISNRVRRKTLIMFILTVVFIITTITYLTMLGLIAGDILNTLSDSGKAAYFFFFRFYFINHVINPLVYGLLDPQFQRAIREFVSKVRGLCSHNCIYKV